MTPSGERLYRVPAWIQRVEQNLAESPIYYGPFLLSSLISNRQWDAEKILLFCCTGIFWNPPKQYQWQNKAPSKPESLRIYEAHGTALRLRLVSFFFFAR